MYEIDIYTCIDDHKPFEIKTRRVESKEEASKVFQEELTLLKSRVKHPKFGMAGEVAQVFTNRKRLIGEIEVSKVK